MNKEQNHAKANLFRTEIASLAMRKQHLSELLAKDHWDASDRLRVNILFQKASYLTGCEDRYGLLIKKINTMKDFKVNTASFAKKLAVINKTK